jgi:hypothetical protein
MQLKCLSHIFVIRYNFVKYISRHAQINFKKQWYSWYEPIKKGSTLKTKPKIK